MQKIYPIFVFLFIIAIIITTVIVSSIGDSSSKPTTGGIIVSSDAGQSWKIVEGSQSLDIISWTDSAFDPSSFYLGTKRNGLWMMTNNGEAIEKIIDKAGVLKDISDVYAISETNSHANILWLAVFQDSHGRVIKLDKNIGGEELYFTPIQRYGIFDIIVDPFNENRIFFGSGDGGFFETLDGGRSWRLIRRFKQGILKIENVGKGEFRLFGAKDGLFYTEDYGRTFVELDSASEPLNGSENLQDFLYDKNLEEAWASYANIIWAAADNQLYNSSDGGKTWTGHILPTERRVKFLIIDKINPQYIYAILH
ncbi:hypothetical protein ACFL3E_01295 [Patescibacteria group bacterium]